MGRPGEEDDLRARRPAKTIPAASSKVKKAGNPQFEDYRNV
jgi:hypothetical protein